MVWMVNELGFNSQQGSHLSLVLAASGAHPFSHPVGARTVSPGVKCPGHEAEYSPPSSAKVKNAWRYTSTPLYVLMAWCLLN
jgi:hypothetical protein